MTYDPRFLPPFGFLHATLLMDTILSLLFPSFSTTSHPVATPSAHARTHASPFHQYILIRDIASPILSIYLCILVPSFLRSISQPRHSQPCILHTYTIPQATSSCRWPFICITSGPWKYTSLRLHTPHLCTYVIFLHRGTTPAQARK